MSLLDFDDEINDKIKFNFYFVGIKINSNSFFENSSTFYGFDYKPIINKNTIIVMWTGETYYSNGIDSTKNIGKVI
jgi:hypothetical protein